MSSKTLKTGDIFSINKGGVRNYEKRYIFCGTVLSKSTGTKKLLLYTLDGSSHIIVDVDWFKDKQVYFIDNKEHPENGHNDRKLAHIYREQFDYKESSFIY